MSAALLLISILAALLPGVAAAQPKTTVTFVETSVQAVKSGAAGRLEPLELTLTGFVTLPADGVRDELRACLASGGAVTFVSDWPASEGLIDVNSDSPPFSVKGPPVVSLSAGLVSVTFTGEGPSRFRNTVKFDVKNRQECSGLNLVFKQWSEDRDGLRIDMGPGQQKLPPFKGKLQVGAGAHGGSLEFSGSWLMTGLGSSASVTTLEVSGKLPIGKPEDIRSTPGAEKDASTQMPDALDLSLNSATYSAGGRLDRKGARLRATGTLRGLEAVGYWSPLFGWFDGSRGFYAAEVEGGWRRGDAEFTGLRTRKPDTGHLIARLGTVVEWAPRLCFAEDKCINGSLAQGLRFFVRARGWLDTVKEQSASAKVRGRAYLDSELFYNFTADSRLFIRAEGGYLPPDLSTRTKRIYIGVGQAF